MKSSSITYLSASHGPKYGIRYHEIFEELTPAERAQRDAEKRRAANEKLNAARQKKTDAARKYQTTLRTSNDAMTSASNALRTIKPS